MGETQTWRVVLASGEVRAVTVAAGHSMLGGLGYFARLKAGDVAAFDSDAHAAVLRLALERHLAPVEILAPGEPTRAELLDALKAAIGARDAAGDAAVAACAELLEQAADEREAEAGQTDDSIQHHDLCTRAAHLRGAALIVRTGETWPKIPPRAGGGVPMSARGWIDAPTAPGPWWCHDPRRSEPPEIVIVHGDPAGTARAFAGRRWHVVAVPPMGEVSAPEIVSAEEARSIIEKAAGMPDRFLPLRLARSVIALHARVAELEAALREVCNGLRSRSGGFPWCTRCGAAWDDEAHGHGCPVGRGLRLLPERTEDPR